MAPRNFARIVLKRSVKVIKSYGTCTTIKTECSLSPSSVPHLVMLFSLVCSLVKVLPIFSAWTLNFYESSMMYNRRTETYLTIAAQEKIPQGSTWLPSQTRRASDISSFLTCIQSVTQHTDIL